jgi:hypothetical protein
MLELRKKSDPHLHSLVTSSTVNRRKAASHCAASKRKHRFENRSTGIRLCATHLSTVRTLILYRRARSRRVSIGLESNRTTLALFARRVAILAAVN